MLIYDSRDEGVVDGKDGIENIVYEELADLYHARKGDVEDQKCERYSQDWLYGGFFEFF